MDGPPGLTDDSENEDATSEYGSREGAGSSEEEEEVSQANSEEEPPGQDPEVLREAGNDMFRRDDLEGALVKYREAVSLCNELDIEETWTESLAKTYSNMALCYNKLKKFDEALGVAFYSLELKSDFPKPYLFLAKSYSGLGNHGMARLCLLKGETLAAANPLVFSSALRELDSTEHVVAQVTSYILKMANGKAGEVDVEEADDTGFGEDYSGNQSDGDLPPPLESSCTDSEDSDQEVKGSKKQSAAKGQAPRGSAPKDIPVLVPGDRGSCSGYTPPEKVAKEENHIRERPGWQSRLKGCFNKKATAEAEKEKESKEQAKKLKEAEIREQEYRDLFQKEASRRQSNAAEAEEKRHKQIKTDKRNREQLLQQQAKEKTEAKERRQKLGETKVISHKQAVAKNEKECTLTCKEGAVKMDTSPMASCLELVKEGCLAFQGGNMATALDRFSKALDIHRKELKGSLALRAPLISSLKYVYARSCIETGSLVNLRLAKQSLEDILAESSFPAAFLGLALLFRKLNRFPEALAWAVKGCDYLDSGLACPPAFLPGWEGELMQETRADYLKTALTDFLSQPGCPTPEAICRSLECLSVLKELRIQPSTSIYLSDPDFHQLFRICCHRGCSPAFHSHCWDQHRSTFRGILGSRNPSHRDFLGIQCLTPDCGGTIISICITDQTGEVKKLENEKVSARVLCEENNAKELLKRQRSEKEEEDKRVKHEEVIRRFNLKYRKNNQSQTFLEEDAVLLHEEKLPEVVFTSNSKLLIKVGGKSNQMEKAHDEEATRQCYGEEALTVLHGPEQDVRKETGELAELAKKIRSLLQAQERGEKGGLYRGKENILRRNICVLSREVKETKEKLESQQAEFTKQREELSVQERRGWAENRELEEAVGEATAKVKKMSTLCREGHKKEDELGKMKSSLSVKCQGLEGCQTQMGEVSLKITQEQERGRQLRRELEKAKEERVEDVCKLEAKNLEDQYRRLAGDVEQRKRYNELRIQHLESLIRKGHNQGSLHVASDKLTQYSVELLQAQVSLSNQFQEMVAQVPHHITKCSLSLAPGVLEPPLLPHHEENTLNLLSTLGLAVYQCPSTKAPFPRPQSSPGFLAPALPSILCSQSSPGLLDQGLPSILCSQSFSTGMGTDCPFVKGSNTHGAVAGPAGLSAGTSAGTGAVPRRKTGVVHEGVGTKKSSQSRLVEKLCTSLPDLSPSEARHYIGLFKEQSGGKLTNVRLDDIELGVRKIIRRDWDTAQETQDCSQEEEECPVCLDEMRKADSRRLRPCGHRFHYKCFDDWLQSSRGPANTCPMCRDTVVRDSSLASPAQR